MSVIALHRWTCTRCRTVVDHQGGNYNPKGWIEVRMGKAEPRPEDGNHLCPECAVLLQEWISGTP